MIIYNKKTLDSGWKDGWVDGWMEGKAGLRIAYSNQKVQQSKFMLDKLRNNIGTKTLDEWDPPLYVHLKFLPSNF